MGFADSDETFRIGTNLSEELGRHLVEVDHDAVVEYGLLLHAAEPLHLLGSPELASHGATLPGGCDTDGQGGGEIVCIRPVPRCSFTPAPRKERLKAVCLAPLLENLIWFNARAVAMVVPLRGARFRLRRASYNVRWPSPG